MTDAPAPIYCANHPGVETVLRCNKCGKPICVKCAIGTPTGYRCRECVRGQQKVFDTARSIDFILGFLAGLGLSLAASLLISLIGGWAGFFSWIIVFVAAPTAGMIIAEGARIATRRHRSRPLFLTVSSAVVLGAVPMLIWNLVTLNLYSGIFQIIYLVLTVPVVYTRLSGIRFNR